MTLRLRTFSTLVVLAASFAGCARGTLDSPITSLNAAGIVSDKTLTPPQKAARLADTAEQLFSAQGFDYANDVLDLAIAQDATNDKALFLKAVLAPVMVQRGIIVRVAPLAALDAKAKDGYDKALADLDSMPDSTLKTFALSGAPDIKTESDIQDHFDAIAASFGQIREFAKTHKNASMIINATDALIPALTERHADLCTVSMLGSYNYKVNCPSQVNMLTVAVDRGDLEVIQQMAAGMEVYMSLFNSYDLSGAIKVAQDEAAKQGQKANPTDLMNLLLSNPKFATLRAGNGIAKLKSLGLDAITGLRWIMTNQSKLCPMGREDIHNRVGALVNTGLCVQASQTADLNLGMRKIEAALNGGTVPVSVVTPTGVVNTVANPSAILDSPIADLRTLSPIVFNNCGDVSSVGDQTLGGLFPNRDANILLTANQKCK